MTFRLSWRDALSDAADLALLGIFLLICAFLVLPFGGALATASWGVGRRLEDGGLPRMSDLFRRFLRSLLPGVAVTAVLIVVTALLLTDIRAVTRGTVPGGGFLALATAIVVFLALGLLGLVVVATGSLPWWGAAKSALAPAWRQPGRLLIAGGIGLLALLLGLVIPVTTPIVLGFWLYALHVSLRRSF
ncbi:hypothetical protein [Hamadaea tsunoensis]|uniref:hypothetical protein n=1 Tax=Hamadaea tsunoensis TaxID=53368 RepID=UPI00041B63B3|nr:hypothetical protein [Hamadaea tsunoensis]